MKTIKYYTKSQYGNNREFIHVDNDHDAYLVRMLTGKQTIDLGVRQWIEELSNKTIQFIEVSVPKDFKGFKS